MSFAKVQRGRGVRRKPGQMNGLEKRYSLHLERERLAGNLIWWDFDAVKLRLAANTFYTPDFLVMAADLTLEIHEVKGFWEDDARVKIKVAAEKFPIRFIALTFEKGEWVREYFGNAEEGKVRG